MKLKEKLNNNEKYKKYKEYKESFKTIWNDPKLGSAIKLSIWLVLILILALIVRVNDNQQLEEPKTPIQEKIETPTKENIFKQLKNIDSYEETITVETEITENIKLTHAQGEDLIIYNNEKYYNKDNLYLLETNGIIENKLLKDIIYFNINNIKDRLQNIEEDYITVYKDNSYVISYTIPTNEIPSFELLETEATNNINITISGKENINKIEINLENYYIKKITLELSNINNIDNINIKEVN